MLELHAERVIDEDRDRGLAIVARPDAGPAFLSQLERTEFGSAGLRYRRLGLTTQLARLPHPVFLELHQRDELIGTYAISRARIACGEQHAEGLYRGLLTLNPNARGAGHGRYFVARVLDWLAEIARSSDGLVISWGCIERRNERSLDLLRSAGSQRLGTLESAMAYRQWPRQRVGVDVIDDPEVVASAFDETHRDCGVRRVGSSSTPFYAVTGDTRIDAGARATMTAISLTRSGGLWETLFDSLMRSVPAARRRYDPQNFRYLRLADVVVRPGKTALWRDFLTTLLAKHDAHMAMFMLDPESQAYSLLGEAGIFGRFAASTRQHIEVLAQAWNTPPGLIDELAGRPLAIGPLDI